MSVKSKIFNTFPIFNSFKFIILLLKAFISLISPICIFSFLITLSLYVIQTKSPTLAVYGVDGGGGIVFSELKKLSTSFNNSSKACSSVEPVIFNWFKKYVKRFNKSSIITERLSFGGNDGYEVFNSLITFSIRDTFSSSLDFGGSPDGGGGGGGGVGILSLG